MTSVPRDLPAALPIPLSLCFGLIEILLFVWIISSARFFWFSVIRSVIDLRPSRRNVIVQFFSATLNYVNSEAILFRPHADQIEATFSSFEFEIIVGAFAGYESLTNSPTSLASPASQDTKGQRVQTSHSRPFFRFQCISCVCSLKAGFDRFVSPGSLYFAAISSDCNLFDLVK